VCAGGGSFGDYFPRAQALREHVAREFRNHRLVVLPQTVGFRREQSLLRAREAFSGGDVVVFCRDAEGAEVLRARVGVRAEIAPDTAVALAPLPRRGEPVHDILWLLRRDGESRFPGVEAPEGVVAADWFDLPRWGGRESLGRWWWRLAAREGRRGWPVRRATLAVSRRIAAERVGRGLELLSSARVVVTDRFHAGLFCLMLGIPHVQLDNANGKVRRFARQWGTAGSGLVRWAETPGEAAEVARELVRAGAGR
jgi:pyruvyl transferase EpsO